MTVARAIIGHTFCVQQRAAAAGSSIGPIASNVPKAWKLATRLMPLTAATHFFIGWHPPGRCQWCAE
jgi:hypothetical protein